MTATVGTLHPAIALLIAYLSGSIPSAYLAGKSRGVDLRQHGSGNLGATNVVRVLGPKIGAAVFAADILKGFLPVMFLPRYVGTTHPQWFALGIGIAAILGHVKPIFLLGRGGGKGVATSAGVFLGLAWLPMSITFGIWLAVFALSRYVSLASLVAAAALPIAMLATGVAVNSPIFIVALLLTAFVFYTHRANIQRLRSGKEHRFSKSNGSRGAA